VTFCKHHPQEKKNIVRVVLDEQNLNVLYFHVVFPETPAGTLPFKPGRWKDSFAREFVAHPAQPRVPLAVAL